MLNRNVFFFHSLSSTTFTGLQYQAHHPKKEKRMAKSSKSYY